MTVRLATLNDVPRLLALAEREHALSLFKADRFDADVAERNLRHAIAGMLTKVFVSEAGFIAGILQPRLFNKFFTAYELAWYAQDGSGMQLLEAFVEWAGKMRAVDVIVSNYAGIKSAESFTRVMRRKGFALLGTTYSKKLEA